MTAAFDSNVTLTIECAFGYGSLDAAPVWTDVTAYARAVEIRRGRSNVLGRFEAGTATVRFDNRSGRFDPNNTAGAYSPNVKVGVPIRIRATYSAVTYDLFRGVVEAWPVQFPDFGKNSVVDVPCVDGMKLLAQFDLSDLSYSAESTETRIGNVLDDVGWPAGLRDVASGVGDVQAYTPDGSQSALTHMMDVAEAEVGALFVDGAGNVVFQNRGHYSGGPVSGGTFGPAALPFQDVAVSYDDEYLWNDVRVTRVGGSEQQYTVAASISDYGRRVLSRSNQPMLGDAEAENVAQWLGQMFSDVRARVSSLVLSPRSDVDLWPLVLGGELRDAVTVTFSPPSGDAFSQDVAIQSVSHVFDAEKRWTTTWEVAPLSDIEQASFWVFDTSTYDTSTVYA